MPRTLPIALVAAALTSLVVPAAQATVVTCGYAGTTGMSNCKSSCNSVGGAYECTMPTPGGGCAQATCTYKSAPGRPKFKTSPVAN